MAYIPPRIAIYSLMIGCVIVKQVKISDMKISELIKKLQEIQAEKGDLLVRIELGDFDVSFGSMDLKVYGNSLYIE